MTAPIALVRLEHHPHGGVWVLDHCPLCHGQHRHGGGGASEDARDFLGLRQPLCLSGDVPPDADFSAGYVLVEAPPAARFTSPAPQQVESAPNSGPREFADSRPDTPTRSRPEERVSHLDGSDATPKPGPGAGTQTRPDGPAGRSEARQRRSTKMAMILTDAKAALEKLSFSSLSWIYRKAQGDKPPVGTSKATLLETVKEMFEEKAKAENGPTTTELSIECEKWLDEVAGDGKPAPKKPEATATPEPEKPAKAKKEPKIRIPKEPKQPKERDSRLPAVGEEIRKTWRERELVVKCQPDGFEFEGKTYKSLSKIASELLGCPANGFLFFALTPAAKEAAARRAEREAAKVASAQAKQETKADPKPEKKAKAPKQSKTKSTKKSKAKSK